MSRRNRNKAVEEPVVQEEQVVTEETVQEESTEEQVTLVEEPVKQEEPAEEPVEEESADLVEEQEEIEDEEILETDENKIDPQPGTIVDEEALKESTVETINENNRKDLEAVFGDAYAVIAESGNTLEALERISLGEGQPFAAALARKILDFNNYATSHIFTIGHSYDLLQIFKSSLKNKTEHERKIALSIIKTAYKVFEKEGFNSLKLFRYVDQWKWSTRELDALTGMHGMFIALIQDKNEGININEVMNLLGFDEEIEATFKTYFNIK